MNSITEIIKGFLWGTGFSLALLGFSTAYYLNLADDIEDSYRDILRVKVINSAKELGLHYELSVLEIFKENNKLRITASIKNVTKDEIYSQPIYVSTYDENGKFIGSCSGKGYEFTLAPQETSYIDIKCDLFTTQVERVVSATIKTKF
jgi:hypothetical protein